MRSCTNLITGEKIDCDFKDLESLHVYQVKDNIAGKLGHAADRIDIVVNNTKQEDSAIIPLNCSLGVLIGEGSSEWDLVYAIHCQWRRAYSFEDLYDLPAICLSGKKPGGRLTVLPSRIRELRNCIYIAIKDCCLRDLPHSIGEVNYLVVLEIQNTYLGTLPESIGDLLCLERLDVSNNYLRELPSSMGKLGRLQFLDVSSNPLEKDLPDWMGYLGSLLELRLSYTGIYTLPFSFGNLGRLRILLLDHNHIKELPQSFRELWELLHLDLTENNPPLKRMPLPPNLKTASF